jgi:hypothetical protein
MNLLNYFEFIIESADSFRLYYSKSFKDILYRIKDNSEQNSDERNIALFLISAENSDQIIDKFTLIDTTEKNDTISLIQGNRILRKFPHLTDNILTNDIVYDEKHEFWKSTSRTQIGIGRWSRRIIKDVYKTTRYNDVALEKFVNAYKFNFDLVNKSQDKFEVVSGEEIKKWYLQDNYKIIRGQLGNSCMKDKNKQSFFEIYTKNPKVCKLLILKDEEDDSKIIGRSLLWNLTNGKKYQDRIYTINDSDKLLFEKWADNNEYLKYDDSFSLDYLEVQLSDNEYEKYPYMDTFIVYNPHTKILKADEDLWPGQGYIKLQNTDGGYKSDNVVYSEYHDEFIDRESAVQCFTQYGDTDWLEEGTAIYLDYKNEWWSPGSNIIWSEFHEDYFLIDDVIHSERLNDYLWTDSDLVIEIESNSGGDVDYVPKSRIDLYIEIDGKYYDKQNIIKDPYTNEWQFKDKMIDGKKYHKYLLEKLEEELGKDKDVVTDKVIKKFKEDDYSDIKDIIKENPIYQKIWGVYWGLSKDMKPNEDDMVCLLFAAIIGSTGLYYPSYIKKFSDDVYNKYNTWYNTDRRLSVRIERFIESFDYSVMDDDIYKMWLWFNL